MDSNSEGSFAWTDASDDTSDNEIMKESGSTVEHSGDESESGIKYKTNLQKQLFANGGSDQSNSKSRKRKLSDSDPTTVTTKKKKIKTEPESDLESVKSIKRKRQSSKHSDSSVDPYHESYLEQKVKNEQNHTVTDSVKRHKKKTKLELSTDNDTDRNLDLSPPREGRAVSPHADEAPLTSDKTEKIKSKRNKARTHTDDSESDDRTGRRRSALDESDAPKGHRRTTDSERATPPRNGTDPNPKRKSRLSDRLTFENDSEDETSGARPPAGRLRAFVRDAAALRPLRRALAPLPSADDELWLVSCPGDVDAAAFLRRTWALAGRCKLELDGRAHEGAAREAPATLAAAGGAAPAVRALPVRGVVRLRRRLPRQPRPPSAPPPRAPVPLPPTRARHPLLGAHYRARLKLGRGVARRLRRATPAPGGRAAPEDAAEPAPEPPPRSEKKKRKRERVRPSADTWDSERAIEETLFAF